MFAAALSSLIPTRATSFRNASIENPRYSLNDPQLYELMTGGGLSAAGVNVTHEGSLAIAAVWQAVTLISGDVAKLPLYPYRRLDDDDRDVASKHPAYFPVAIRANPDKSAKRFWKDMVTHRCIWNNGYAWISRKGARIELYNLLPDRTAPEWVKTEGGQTQLIYVTEIGGKLETLLPSEVLHIRGISIDGIQGCDLVKYARDAWGLALAAQGFESKFFKNGARVGGILEVPIGTGKLAKDNIEEGFRQSYESGDNPFKTVILRDGAKFHSAQVTPEQGQVTQIEEQQVRKVASYFNLPPSKLGIRDSVSYNSFEQESLAYLQGCLHHVADDVSDECDMKLLSEQELRDDKLFFEHNYSDFVQSDWVTLTNGLKTLRDAEIVNPNECRKKLNMKRRKDPGGEDYTNPNTRSAQDATKAPPPKPTPAKPVKNANHDWLADTLNRMARRLGQDARREAKNSGKFERWLSTGVNDHRAVVVEALLPVAVSGGDKPLADNAQAELFTSFNATLSPLLEPPFIAADLAANVDNAMTNFERTAGGRIASLLLKESDDE